MAERNWTREQLEAISCSANDILVSAGAGSGKTAVLTERIIRRLCDEENPADITRMLIVTFTNAATEELRSRVAAALRARLAEDPGNRRLRRQLLLLPSANIYTISSFCLGIVRANLNSLGLPAGLRVCDETESNLLAMEVMDQVIDGFYEGIFECPADFGEFCDAFVSDRDDNLAELFLGLYARLREYVAGVGLLKNNAQALAAAAEGDTNFMTTPWGRSVAGELRTKLGYYIAVLERALDMFYGDEKLTKAYSSQFAHDLEFARELDAMLAGGAKYGTIREYIGNFQSKRLGVLRNYEMTPELEFYKSSRSDFSSGTSTKPVRETSPGGDGFIKNIYHKYFSVDPYMLRQVLSGCARQCETFYAVLSTFEERFLSEKRRRAIADFSDLERYAYRLLRRDDGSISDAAAAIAAEYDELYIDEYQDTNELEDMIFAALAKAGTEDGERERVRFMVGDVKQSIYGFRGAEPSLFASYRSDPTVMTLFLRSNFRCDRPVIEFVNRVSEYIFTGTGSEVDYGEGDKLVFAKTSGSKDCPVRVVVFDGVSDDSQESEDENSTDADVDEGIEIGEKIESEAESPAAYGEPEFVADEVARLIASGEYAPGDIAILLRSTQNRAEVYEQALRARGIGSSGGGSDFFERPEVSAMLCLLCSVNNPSHDIYLAGALRSPFFGFTLDDLVRIRRFIPPQDDGLPFYLGDEAEPDFTLAPESEADESSADTGTELPHDPKSVSLYEALVHFTKTTGFEKGKRFLEKLALYRKYAEANSADRVVRFIYRDIGAQVFAAGGGDPAEVTARRRNLMRLYELARTFEHGQFRGLGSFIEFVEGLVENGSLTAPPADSGKSGVKIMSIHKSKGLEFPVVFVCDCARRFNMKDTQQPILFDSKLGASAKLGDSSGFGVVETPVRTATSLRMTRRMKYEEMRALYVALTRARERLYVTATAKNPDRLLQKAEFAADFLPAGARAAEAMDASNFIGWILTAMGGRSSDFAALEIYGADGLPARIQEAAIAADATESEPGSSESVPETPEISSDEVERCKTLFAERLAFSYRFKPLETLPAKLSVSKLYPSILDEGEGDGALDWEEVIPPELAAEMLGSGGLGESESGEKSGGSVFEPPRFLADDPEAVTAAERGTATHVFMQFCDFDYAEKHGVEGELERLVAGRFITAAHAKLVDVRAVERFFRSPLYAELRDAKELHREVRFNVRLPASEFTQDENLKTLLAGEPVLVQGVIDCYYETKDGGLRLVDYKTDYIPREMRADPGRAEELLIARHSRQLGYYARAIEKLTGRPVERSAIYSFALGRPIYINRNGD